MVGGDRNQTLDSLLAIHVNHEERIAILAKVSDSLKSVAVQVQDMRQQMLHLFVYLVVVGVDGDYIAFLIGNGGVRCDAVQCAADFRRHPFHSVIFHHPESPVAVVSGDSSVDDGFDSLVKIRDALCFRHAAL